MALRKAKVSSYLIKTKEFAFGAGYLIYNLGSNFLLGACWSSAYDTCGLFFIVICSAYWSLGFLALLRKDP